MSRHDPRVRLGDTAAFYARLGEEADTRLEPGYDQDEVFDDQFERRAREIQQTPGAAGAVSIIPSKQGPWTGNGQLGNERPFAPDSNNRQTILKLDEWGFPEVWSVLLGIEYDETQLFAPPGVRASFSVTCTANIGIGGATQVLELDWKQGASFSAPMNALNIVATYDIAESTVIPDDLRLRVTLAKGKLTSIPPTRTLEFTSLGDGSFHDLIEIPKFSQRVSLSLGDASALPSNVIYDASNTLALFAQSDIAGTIAQRISGDQVLWFPDGWTIGNTARFISFASGVGQPIQGSYHFHLGL